MTTTTDTIFHGPPPICRWCEATDATTRTHALWAQCPIALCDNCYDRRALCEFGGHYVDSDRTSVEWCDSRGEHVCEVHLDVHFRYCERCEEYERYGDDCPRRLSAGAMIHEYCHRPDPIFAPSLAVVPDGVPFFGVEIECEFDCEFGDDGDFETALGEIRGRDELERWSYFKEDASLSDGVEYVTHPRTLTAWRETADALALDLATLDHYGAAAWDANDGGHEVGQHVHVSRDAFDNVGHLAAFTLLFVSNESDATRFAGRAAGYATFRDLRGNVVRKVENRGYNHHAEAVNLCGRATVEVRIFRSSLAAGRVLAAVEMVAAAFDYTRLVAAASLDCDDMPRGDGADREVLAMVRGGLAWSEFREWVIRSGDRYALAARVLADPHHRFAVADTLAGSIGG